MNNAMESATALSSSESSMTTELGVNAIKSFSEDSQKQIQADGTALTAPQQNSNHVLLRESLTRS